MQVNLKFKQEIKISQLIILKDKIMLILLPNLIKLKKIKDLSSIDPKLDIHMEMGNMGNKEINTIRQIDNILEMII
jgi:hypothetical protein